MIQANSIALVTGGSAGIGATYADRLAARGKDLILVARRPDRLEAAAEALRQKYGRTVETVTADLGDLAGLAAIKAILRDNGRIDTLVNNAGLGALGASATADIDAIEQLVRVNILALTSLSLAAAPVFKGRNRGAMINVSSLIAFKASPFAAAYCGSKAYVVNFTRSLQAEFAGTEVKIQLVIPGPVHSEFTSHSSYAPPEELFFAAETLVDCSMHALDHGEEVCIPALHDLGAWETYLEALQGMTKATQNGDPAPRYRIA